MSRRARVSRRSRPRSQRSSFSFGSAATMRNDRRLRFEQLEERRLLALTAMADSYATNSGILLVVDAGHGVLANDVDAAGALASVSSSPVHGTLNFSADGSFTYTPTAGFVGTDTFSYRAQRSLLPPTFQT